MAKILQFAKPNAQPVTTVHVLANAYAEYMQTARTEGFKLMFARFDNSKQRPE